MEPAAPSRFGNASKKKTGPRNSGALLWEVPQGTPTWRTLYNTTGASATARARATSLWPLPSHSHRRTLARYVRSLSPNRFSSRRSSRTMIACVSPATTTVPGERSKASSRAGHLQRRSGRTLSTPAIHSPTWAKIERFKVFSTVDRCVGGPNLPKGQEGQLELYLDHLPQGPAPLPARWRNPSRRP